MPSVRPIVRRFALVSAAAYALALSACSSSSTPSTSSPSNSGFAQVRAVHGSPDAGPVDIYVYPGGKSRVGVDVDAPLTSNTRWLVQFVA